MKKKNIYIHQNIFTVPFKKKGEVNASAKNIDLGQPAPSAPAYQVRNFSLLANVLLCPRTIKSIVKKICRLWIQGPDVPTILKNVLSLVLQIFLYLAAIEVTQLLIG